MAVIQVFDRIFNSEQVLVHRTINVFDIVVGSLDVGDENEILIYLLVSSLYLCQKVAHSDNLISFEEYLSRCSKLETFMALEVHLVEDEINKCCWRDDLHPSLEKECLSILKFKVERVTSAQVIFELVCAFSHDQKQEIKLEKILQEALFLSYICLLGKYNRIDQLFILENSSTNAEFLLQNILFLTLVRSLFDH